MNVSPNNDDGAPSAMRGRGYTRIEDLLACKAFISASEDSVKGTSQKGKEFKSTLHASYKLLLREQLIADKLKWNSASIVQKEVLTEPQVYDDRTPDSVYSRLKDTIFPRVMKFLGIEETTLQQSGSNAKNFYQKCKAVFEKRYPAMGNPDTFPLCKEYLQTKPKFASFRRMMEQEEETKKGKSSRPLGKKKQQDNEQDQKLIKKALGDAGLVVDVLAGDESTGGGGGSRGSNDAMQSVMTVLASLGQSVVSFWKEESEGKFIEALPTPEKKEIKSELAQLKLLEARQKRRKIELEAKEDELKLAALALKLQMEQQAAELQATEKRASQLPGTIDVVVNRASSVASSDKESADGGARRELFVATPLLEQDVCCAKSECIYEDEDEKLAEGEEPIPLTCSCLNCRGKCHTRCARMVNANIFVCWHCVRNNK